MHNQNNKQTKYYAGAKQKKTKIYHSHWFPSKTWRLFSFLPRKWVCGSINLWNEDNKCKINLLISAIQLSISTRPLEILIIFKHCCKYPARIPTCDIWKSPYPGRWTSLFTERFFPLTKPHTFRVPLGTSITSLLGSNVVLSAKRWGRISRKWMTLWCWLDINLSATRAS